MLVMRGSTKTQYATGKVTFFHNRDKYGFIAPDTAREDGKKIHFRFDDACAVYEATPGELRLNDTIVPDLPVEGDQIVFSYYDPIASKPSAYMWNYQFAWNRAKVVIAGRPWPECPFTRIVQVNREYNSTEVVWMGYYPHLLQLLDRGKEARFHPDIWYNTVWCEEHTATGWKEMTNHLDPDYRSQWSPYVSRKERIILAKYKRPQWLPHAISLANPPVS